MEEIIEKIIKYGNRFGQVEVLYGKTSLTNLSYRNKKYHSSFIRENEGIEIRIINGKKYGTAEVRIDEWRKGVDTAVKNMKINSKLKSEIGLPSNKKSTNRIYSSKIDEMKIKDMEEIIKTIQSEKYTNIETNITISKQEIIYANKETLKKTKSTKIELMNEIKNGDALVGYDLSDYKPFKYEKVLEEAEKRAELYSNKKKFEPKVVDVVFTPEGAYEFIETLLKAFSGSLITKHRSYLVDKYKKQVFSKKLNIKAIPNKKIISAYSFDREGNPTEERYLVKNGKVVSFLLDRYSAKILNMRKPMHAISLTTIPSADVLGPFEIEKGSSTVSGDLIIDETMGWHTVDPISGNVSVSIINGLMNGVPVKDGMIAFNIFDALKEVEIGRKQKRVSNLILPKIKIKAQFIG